MLRTTKAMLAFAGLMCAASTGTAQRPDSGAAVPVPPGAFVGSIKNSVNKAPVRSVDLRLYFIDTVTMRDSSGNAFLESFVDSARSRLALSDSAGNFAAWRVPKGRYLMYARRIGYTPLQAIITIDTTTVLHDFIMEPLAPILAAVEITETTMPQSMVRRLKNTGFTNRSKFGVGRYYTKEELMKHRPLYLRDMLQKFGLHGGEEYLFDRMPLSFSDIQDYPAELIAGIEVYRHNRPIEFSMTRGGPSLIGGGVRGAMLINRPLVVIWSY